MAFTEVKFYNDPSLNDALIAWLGESDFDMFEERSNGLNAYINSEKFSAEAVGQILSSLPEGNEIRFEYAKMEDKNWNAEWESNFQPVLIAGRVFIRAPFHEPGKGFQYEIIIEPKMSFGTGHHATTAMMIELMLQIDFENKTVLDMGSGSGILAIFADMALAKSVDAIDNDEWAYENCKENILKNNSKHIHVFKGDMRSIKSSYDIILANINRNVLLSDIPNYVQHLNPGGALLVSGFLLEDKEVIQQCAHENGLQYITQATQNNWLAIYYQRPEDV